MSVVGDSTKMGVHNAMPRHDMLQAKPTTTSNATKSGFSVPSQFVIASDVEGSTRSSANYTTPHDQEHP